ncbi:MAG: translation initiation factor IF-2 [Ignavibacteria bacterium]|nr:translation initiation factor IF-2 [Ignavibacteria bacterium]
MAGSTGNKLFKIASQINIGRDAIVEYLASKGHKIENKATTVLSDEQSDLVIEKFAKELKTAQKQREKVQRQQQVRKTQLEQGSAVSIDTIAEAHEREREIEERLERPADSHTEETPQVEAAAPVAPPPAAPVVVAEAPAAPVVAEVPEPPTAPEAAPVVAETPAPAAVPEPVPTPAPEPESTGPAVGAVIDLSAIGKPKEEPKPTPPPLPKQTAKSTPPSKAVPAPAAPVAPPVAEEAAPAEASAPVEGEAPAAAGEEGDGTKAKRKRKGVIEVEYKPGGNAQLRGLTVLGKIDLTPKAPPRPKRNERGPAGREGGPRGAIGDQLAARGKGPGQGQGGSATGGSAGGGFSTNRPPRPGGGGPTSPGLGQSAAAKKAADKKRKAPVKGMRTQVSDSDVERAIRQTLSGMELNPTGGRAKLRQRKRMEREEKAAIRQEERAREDNTLRLSEFVTTADLANMMRVTASDIIMKCMSLGLMVSINQRLDKDTITLIASDYGYEVSFLDDQSEQDVEDDVDAEETLRPRSPIVTIMGHVDHGKTSLLDHIRNANVVAGEAGGITQHIGAYRVETDSGRSITFLDTPGHEAFTAMRARGAQVTDIVVLVVAADDSVMPQTIEAISHAQAANVPIVVAINKVDRPESNPDRIRQQLADHGVLVEDWGGKYQVAEISAKLGTNIPQLLEKILLEADILELKANPDRNARATVIEAHVDKGRGNVVTVIVQKGTLNVGDIFVCGQFAGRVRAMFDERGNRMDSAGPSMPAQVTGFDGLPNSGDILYEMETDAEARDVATRRQQLRREQQFRGMRHMTLDDISAQIQQGGVKELRLIVRADVSGSVEALSDSLQKLSTPEVKVHIIFKAVGAITESDVMLASASDAVIVGFQVNTSPAARKVAEAENVDVRLYSIIYDCINEVQLALEGMLTPDIKEEITSGVEVRAIFKISKLGTIAGCYVLTGKITRNDKVRVLRDGFEIFKGTLSSLKRVKDDVREVDAGYECGIALNGFNDLEVGDIIEGYKTIEVKRKLS